MNHLVRILPCVLVAGCSSLAAVSPVVDDQVIVATVQQCGAPEPVDPITFMEVGFTKVKAACEVFFVNATKVQQNALAANTALNAGQVGATAILNATASASAAAKAITITQAGVVLAEALITDYVNVYTFNTYLYKVRQLVQSTMADYAKKARVAPPANYCIAYSYVSDFASLCSLASMKALLDEQVALPSNVNNTQSASTGAAKGGGPRALFRAAPGAPAPYGAAPSPSYSVYPATN